MEPDWTVEHIIDWGSGTGSGLWWVHFCLVGWSSRHPFVDFGQRASLHSFQKSLDLADKVDEPTIANSTIISYLGIDKREGLINIGKRLLRGTGNFFDH